MPKETSSVVEMTSALCRIDTTSGNTKNILKAQDSIIRFLRNTNVPMVVDCYTWKGVPNTIIRSKKTRTPDVCFVGHVDVVPAESEKAFEPVVRKNKLYARGALDMKSGIAAMVHAYRDILTTNTSANVALMITGDEELGGFNGAKKCLEIQRLQPGFAITVEGMVKTHIINRQKGVCIIALNAKSKSGHSAYPWKNVNPIQDIAQAVEKISTHFGVAQDAWQTTVSWNTTSTTNTALNKTPSDAEATLDIRFIPQDAQSPELLIKSIRNMVHKNIHVELLLGGSPLYTDEQHPSVLKLQQLTNKVYGKTLQLGFSHGASDGRFFSERNIPCVEYGPVGKNSHSENEYVEIPSILQVQKVLTQLGQQ